MERAIGELFDFTIGWTDTKTGEPVVIPLSDVYYSGKSYPFGDTIIWKLERKLADGTTTSYLKTTEEVRDGVRDESTDLGNEVMTY